MLKSIQPLLSTVARESPSLALKHTRFIKRAACRGLSDQRFLELSCLVTHVLQEPEQCPSHLCCPASARGPQHPRELGFQQGGEGELTATPPAASPAAATAAALGGRVLSQPAGDSLGHPPVQRRGAPRNLCLAPQQEALSPHAEGGFQTLTDVKQPRMGSVANESVTRPNLCLAGGRR